MSADRVGWSPALSDQKQEREARARCDRGTTKSAWLLRPSRANASVAVMRDRRARDATLGLADNIAVSQQRPLSLPAPRIVQGVEQQNQDALVSLGCVWLVANGVDELFHGSHPPFASFECRIQKM